MLSDFEQELLNVSSQVDEYLDKNQFKDVFCPDEILHSSFHYLELGGKRLRPAVTLFSCGAVGGDPSKALPAAAAVEIWHNFTLAHDDIIDQDEKRRNGETVHVRWNRESKETYGWNDSVSNHFGNTVGILTGDVQQGWAIAKLMPDLYYSLGIDPKIALKLTYQLGFVTLTHLVEGETLDVLYSRTSLDNLDENMIQKMMAKKTGALFQFCGLAGAMIGLNTDDEKNHIVDSLANFAFMCGTAFQIQDDILGITANETKLGKPVGSDIIRGNRTIPLLRSFSKANDSQKQLIQNTLGNQSASKNEIDDVINLIQDLGGVDYAKDIANSQINTALNLLNSVPDSKFKRLLSSWAEFMLNRSL